MDKDKNLGSNTFYNTFNLCIKLYLYFICFQVLKHESISEIFNCLEYFIFILKFIL